MKKNHQREKETGRGREEREREREILGSSGNESESEWNSVREMSKERIKQNKRFKKEGKCIKNDRHTEKNK